MKYYKVKVKIEKAKRVSREHQQATELVFRFYCQQLYCGRLAFQQLLYVRNFSDTFLEHRVFRQINKKIKYLDH